MIGKALAVGLVCTGITMGQAAIAPQAAPVAAAKPLAFDVVSIRQNTSGPSPGLPQFGPTQDGYRMINMSLIVPILTAYVPQTPGISAFTPNQIVGLPDWVMRDQFDLDAKVSDEDLPEWQKPDKQKAMLAAMMQSLLQDRCKMVSHREVKDVAVYSLVVGKNGPKFKPTNPDENHEGSKLPFGGILSPGPNGMTLYAAPMTSLAAILSDLGRMGTGRLIQDKTGLTGLYDIVLTQPGGGYADRRSPQDASAASDPGGNNFASSMAESLGLKLESTKAPVETLIVDHMEKPSEN